MRNAIILHGKPSKDQYYNSMRPAESNAHWIPWLQKQLIVKNIIAQTPEIPESFAPKYEIWLREFERYEVTADTILVGHSCGGGFLVRWLSENRDRKVGKVVLVAPWIDPDRKAGDFFEFDIDSALVGRTKGLTIFYSTDDKAVRRSVLRLRNAIANHMYKEFEDFGHFTQDSMGTVEFPELLEEALT